MEGVKSVKRQEAAVQQAGTGKKEKKRL